MIEKYEKYLELITPSLSQKFFEQKDFINCKSGCSLCCEVGQYPFSDVEFQYAMLGYNSLSDNQKKIVQEKILKIKEEKNNSTDEKFMHECPFLIDKKCSIYRYRGIVCRTHGLLFYYTDENGQEKNKAPGCMHFGLNYSNIYDKNIRTISMELLEKSGIKSEPIAYNVGRDFMLNNSTTKSLELKFGQEKALIEWFL